MTRNVPHHELSLLAGCSEEETVGMARLLGEAITVGVPLYNGGNFGGCYHVYAGAALDVEHRLRPQCGGPRRALAEGRRRAEKLDDPAAQAWAMRDAIDGIFDVIGRKIHASHQH